MTRWQFFNSEKARGLRMNIIGSAACCLTLGIFTLVANVIREHNLFSLVDVFLMVVIGLLIYFLQSRVVRQCFYDLPSSPVSFGIQGNRPEAEIKIHLTSQPCGRLRWNDCPAVTLLLHILKRVGNQRFGQSFSLSIFLNCHPV